MALKETPALMMLTRAPEFTDPEQTLLSRQIFLIVRAFVVSAVILQLMLIAMDPRITLRWGVLLLATVTVSGILLWLNRRGRVLAAAWLLVVSLWLLIGIFSWTRVGLGTRAAYGYFIVVFIAGMVLGKWQGIGTAAICSASTLLIALQGPIRSMDPYRFWLVNTLYLVVVLLLQNLAGRFIRESLARARSELHGRQLAEIELRKSEERFRVLFESGPIGIVAADEGMRITLANRAFCAMLGYSEDELRGMHFQNVTHPEHAAADRRAVQELLRAEAPFYRAEKRYLRKDGGVVWASTTVSVIRDAGGRFLHLLAMVEDISARKRAEKEREHVISLLQATLESTADGILEINSSGKIANYNQRFVGMWRIPEELLAACDDNQALDFVMRQLVDPGAFMAKVNELYENPELESFDLLEFKDGRFFERYSRPQMIDGRPVGRVWSFRDVSRQKRDEKALRQHIEFERLLTSTSARFVGVRTGDIDGEIDLAIRQIGVFTGVDRSYVFRFARGGEFMSNTHEWCADGVESQKENLQNLPVASFPWWMSRLQGNAEIAIERLSDLPPEAAAESGILQAQGIRSLLVVPIRSKSMLIGYLGFDSVRRPRRWSADALALVRMVADIIANALERKQAAEALLESERRYRTLFEAASDAIFVMKGELFFDCNSQTLQMFGCGRERIIGMPPDWFSPPLQPDGMSSQEKSREKIRAAYAGQPQFFEWVHLREDGSPFIAEVSLTRIDLAADVYLLAMVRDVSERKKLEEQLLQAQKMEAIGILAGGVAHDFNNILSAIVGYGSLLQMKMERGGPLSDYVERILAAGERAANLTSSLLAFSRKQEAELLPIDINDAIYGFHKILARLIGEDIDFSLNLASESLVIDADARQFEQVLMNLVTNSRDAMPRGGRLTISTAAVVLDSGSGEIPAGPYAVIAVSDSGTGIGNEIRSHIFEPFFTTKEVGKGTGLGLAIVYGIVKKHKGHIRVESAPEGGSTFTIYLPLKSAAKNSHRRRKPEAIPMGSETILLIEDDPAVRQVTRSMLEEFGYTVLEAADGVSAQYVFREHARRIDLVVCDLLMPRLNGRETLAALRRMKAGIPAIFISGYASDIIAQKGLADSGARLLTKPLNPGTLLRQVRSILDQFRASGNRDADVPAPPAGTLTKRKKRR